MDNRIRRSFPSLERLVGPQDKPLVYLDSAATSFMPDEVIQALSDYEIYHRSNIHRGIHTMAEESTDIFESTREALAAFIDADPRCIIFTHGTTESINLAAYSWAKSMISRDDILVYFEDNHHSNIVPWQIVAREIGCKLCVVEVERSGIPSKTSLKNILESSPKLIALGHISNVTGFINDIKDIAELAHAAGAKVLLDGAQSFGHIPVSVKELGVDFYAASCHKAYGPFGLGFLWCAPSVLDEMKPSWGGGGMVSQVTRDSFTPIPGNSQFEAGTPSISAAAGLKQALECMNAWRLEDMQRHCSEIIDYACNKLRTIEGVTLLGDVSTKRQSLVSFTCERLHPHDIAALLDQEGVALRAGNHCAIPLHRALNATASLRASIAVYTSIADIDQFVSTLEYVLERGIRERNYRYRG